MRHASRRASGSWSAALLAARFAAAGADRLERLILVVPFGLAPFQPTPVFGAALTGYLTQPSERTHDELWNQCVFDLEGLQRQPEARWELIKAYNLDLAQAGSATGAIHAVMDAFGVVRHSGRRPGGHRDADEPDLGTSSTASSRSRPARPRVPATGGRCG